MTWKKRSFAEFAAASEPTVTVITADGGRIPAHSEVLRLVCSCLKNAPASDTWDLSTLLVNGSPVSAETATAVLQVIYSSLEALEFEMDRSPGQYSLPQLQEMLLFADAVGCSKGMIYRIAGLLGACVPPKLQITLPRHSSSEGHHAEASSTSGRGGGRAGRGRGRGGRGAAEPEAEPAAEAATVDFRISLDGVYTMMYADVGLLGIISWRSDKCKTVKEIPRQQVPQLQQQLTQQLEELLYVAFKLDLQPLLQRVLRFIRANAILVFNILGNSFSGDQQTDAGVAPVATAPAAAAPVDAVFTPRVLSAAGSSSGQELLERACLQQPLGLGFGIGSVFGDVEWHEAPVVKFSATLRSDLYEFKAGTQVDVRFRTNGRMNIVNKDAEDMNEWAVYPFGVCVGPEATFQQAQQQDGTASEDSEWREEQQQQEQEVGEDD